jgi:hypothetical protein
MTLPKWLRGVADVEDGIDGAAGSELSLSTGTTGIASSVAG